MAGDELAPFVLENIKEMESGEKKGSGAYGVVYKVTVNGVPCIGKRLHDILVKPEVPRRQRESIREKFHRECVILSKLRHPHIVHFVGVHSGLNPSDLSLVMEYLHTDLAKFLDEHQEKGVNIPLSIKLSILLDVSYGLLYLHMLIPPIIHRDLSASNILLTANGLQAKIADLGVSKLLDFQTQTKISQTKVPGSQNYMPPEALTENPQYGLKLDVFSFGHLMLYTTTQEFPGVHEVTLTSAILQQGIIQIVKRQKAISKMGGERHCLHSLVLQCLRDKPEQRPTTPKLNECLKEQCTKHPRRMAEVLQLSSEADVGRAQLEEVKQTKDSARKLELDNKQLSEQLNKLSGLNADRNAVINGLKAQVRRLEQEKETLLNEAQIAKTEAQLEQVKQKEELELKNKQLSEQLSEIVKLNADGNAAINELKAQVRELEQEKEALQNEVQIARTEAQVYREDFALERHDREVAHGMYADIQRKYAYDVGKLKEELAQMEEHHKERLAEMEHVFQRREKEMKSVLEASTKKKNQQVLELQAKTTQVKHYKKRVDSLRDQLTELEGCNKEVLKEREKLFRELDKTRKELVQAKTKAEAEKTKKDAKRGKKESKKKLSDKGATSPEATEVSKALQGIIAKKEQLYEGLRNENDTLLAELEECRRANEGLKKLLTPRPESLLLAQSRETSQSPLTSLVVDFPAASYPEQQPSRILEEDEEIELEKVKQTLDLQFHKQRQSLQSIEEQTYAIRASTLSGRGIPNSNAPPVQCIHKQPSPIEHFQEQSPPVQHFQEKSPPVEHSHASGFEAQLNASPGAQPYIGPAVVQQINKQPLPPSPLQSPTMSPSGSEIHQLLPLYVDDPSGKSQQIPADTDLGAPQILPQGHAYPQTPPVHHWNESHPLSSQNPPQSSGTKVPRKRPILKWYSCFGGEFEQQIFKPRVQQASQMQASPSSSQEHLRSPSKDQYSTDESYSSAPLPSMDVIDPEIPQCPKQFESSESVQ